jgi:hypothetical protein
MVVLCSTCGAVKVPSVWRCEHCGKKHDNRRAPAPAAPQGVEVALTNLVEFTFAHPNHSAGINNKRQAVLTAIAAHVASEREAAIEELAQWFDDGPDAGWHDGAEVAAAIRARKDAGNV